MKTHPDTNVRKGRVRRRGFSLAELVIVLALAASVITAGVMAYQAVTATGSRHGSYGAVTIGAARMNNFYGENATAIDTYFAPNYGRAILATQLQERLMEDIGSCVAVFCLGRNGLNPVRPLEIPVNPAMDFRLLDSPNAFLNVLDAAFPTEDVTSIFVPYRGASPSPSATIFMLRPSGDPSALWTHAIYEMDIIGTETPTGVYASVRRYEAGVLTDYYDIFYPDGFPSAPFIPVVAAFERGARRATAETNVIDAFKAAAERPFYFVWWPDPALPNLEPAGIGYNFPNTDPRAGYSSMAGRTAFFTVLPMFPAL